jgi:hypothetical protein
VVSTGSSVNSAKGGCAATCIEEIRRAITIQAATAVMEFTVDLQDLSAGLAPAFYTRQPPGVRRETERFHVAASRIIC